jgi:hypothetical protein
VNSGATVADDDLLDLVAEGRAALAAPSIQRVHACLTVLPRLVDALDRVALYQLELREIRQSLTTKVRKLREEVWAAQKMHPEVTYRSAQVQQAIQAIGADLDRLDRLLFQATDHG